MVFFAALSLPAQAQLLINEVSSTNDSLLADQEGDYPDWIELYNAGSSAVSLKNYSLTCSGKDYNKWIFPDVTIQPLSYFSVFASGKDRKAFTDHLELPIYYNLPWRYYKGTSASPPANWNALGFNDSSWSLAKGSFGYGDGDDTTNTGPVYSVYMRQYFTLADTSKITLGAIAIDYDDGFVAYLNGKEIARSNLGVTGDKPAYNTYANDDHEAALYQGGKYEFFFVPRQMLDSIMVPGLNVFSVQVHNVSLGSADLSAIPNFIIGIKDNSVTYPVIPIGDVQLHTNFTLPSEGEKLVLADASGKTLDDQVIQHMQINHSRGRQPNGGSYWCLFDRPTPNKSNNTSNCYTGFALEPTFSLKAGFYNGTQQVSLSTNQSNTLIRYTKDGSIPTNTSAQYTVPINVDSTKVIRARCFPSSGTLLPSEVATNSYFINDTLRLPVVSISGNPDYFFNFFYGIYMLGPTAEFAPPNFGANFWKGWKRQGHVEFFDTNGNQGFELRTSLKIQGNFSKCFAQKGFTVEARDDYNEAAIQYPLFPDKPAVTSVKCFNLRNFGGDWNGPMMRDRLSQKNVQKMTHLDIMDGFPCIVYLNGKYWGVYELRERQDESYLEQNHGVDPGQVDLLEFQGSVIAGSSDGFESMVDFITNNNMAVQANYDSVKTMLDIENFADYFITETYYANWDWVTNYGNNTKFWRPRTPGGKWRYILWDTDLGLGAVYPYNTNHLDSVFLFDGPHSNMLVSLLKNTEFKNYFINRYADLMNTVFEPEDFIALTSKMALELYPNLPRHFAKWGGTSYPGWGYAKPCNVAYWYTQLLVMADYIVQRQAAARNYVQLDFSLPKQVTVTLDVMPAGAGIIKISTIYPDTLPWTGVYYNGVPVTITAIPNAGYKFDHWSSANIITSPDPNAAITLDIGQDDAFTAYFVPTDFSLIAYPNPFNDQLTIHYNLKAPGQVSMSLYSVTGQRTMDVLPEGSFQEAGEHSISVTNTQLAQGMYFLRLKAEGFEKTVKLVLARD